MLTLSDSVRLWISSSHRRKAKKRGSFASPACSWVSQPPLQSHSQSQQQGMKVSRSVCAMWIQSHLRSQFLSPVLYSKTSRPQYHFRSQLQWLTARPSPSTLFPQHQSASIETMYRAKSAIHLRYLAG